MTREEAIEIFKNMLDAWDNYYTIAQSDKKREAVELAISSLETDEAYQLEYERTTKNDLGVDCISRESVLELLNDYRDKHFENRKEYPVNYGTLLDILRWIRNLPLVTPQEPKTGEWIEHFDESGKWYECDQCHTDWGGAVNYCPNCGADMRGEE